MPLCALTGENPCADMTRSLARKGHAFLSLRLFDARRPCRQLQHGCILAFAQEGQKKGLPVRQFERVMVHMRLVTIDLAENCGLVPSGSGSSIDCDFRIEGKLRAGKHANCGAGIARSGEPAGAGAEVTRSKLVANARGTRFDVHQAVVAHGLAPLFHICASNARGQSWFTAAKAPMSAPQHNGLELTGWHPDSHPTVISPHEPRHATHA